MEYMKHFKRSDDNLFENFYVRNYWLVKKNI